MRVRRNDWTFSAFRIAVNPFAPQFTHRLRVRTPERTSVERLRAEPTYNYQLRAFADAIRNASRADGSSWSRRYTACLWEVDAVAYAFRRSSFALYAAYERMSRRVPP